MLMQNGRKMKREDGERLSVKKAVRVVPAAATPEPVRPAVAEQYRGNTRSINEYPLDPDELEFINAINAYKQTHNRSFPTWSEVLHVLRFLGYRKVAPPGNPAKSEASKPARRLPGSRATHRAP